METADPKYYNMMYGLNQWQYNQNGSREWTYAVYPYNGETVTASGYFDRIKGTTYMNSFQTQLISLIAITLTVQLGIGSYATAGRATTYEFVIQRREYLGLQASAKHIALAILSLLALLGE